MSDKVECCYVGEDGQGCSAEGEWLILAGDEAQEPTYACTPHVGYLLSDCPLHTICYVGHPKQMLDGERSGSTVGPLI